MENKSTNIVEQINRGSIRVNTIQEFKELIEDFPDDPAIHKAYADLLVKKKSLDQAASSYGKAAALYLNSGKLLPAVLTKLLQWQIKSPVQVQGESTLYDTSFFSFTINFS